MAKQKSFRITHLSDFHLTKFDGARRSEPKLFSPLKGMNNFFREIIKTKYIKNSDFVLVTGDVTDRGHIEAWKLFWDAITTAGLLGKIAVIPGNHDVCCLGARLPGKRKSYSDSDLKKAIKGLKLGNQPIKFPWVVNPDPRVVIFGLNSNNLGNYTVASNAMGELSYYQLKSLASKMHIYRDIPVKIVALHHSPNIPEIDTAIKRGQRPMNKLEREGHQIPQDQRHGLMLLCITHRVRLVVHGHLHLSENRRVGGIRIIGAPASTEPLMKGRQVFQFYSYTIQGRGGRIRCELKTINV